MTLQQRVKSLAEQPNSHCAYPRPDYIDLHSYLNNSAKPRPSVETKVASTTPPEDFVVLHNLANGTNTTFAASPEGLSNFTAHSRFPSALIFFLRGFPSSEWLEAVGTRHGSTPELYRRHLDLKGLRWTGREMYTSPSVPSASSRVFQLTLSTICKRGSRGADDGPEDLQDARRRESKAMTEYFKHLRSMVKIGDSIVRNCSLLSKHIYVIQQTITVEVARVDEKCRIFVWLDNGRDLAYSPPGPWMPHPDTQRWETYFYPVIVCQKAPTLPLRTTSSSLFQTDGLVTTHSGHTTTNSRVGPADEWRAEQNICLLPVQYGSSLDKTLASKDALYALSELLRFVASGEAQFQNLLQESIEHELSFVGSDSAGNNYSLSLLNLKYIKSLLTSHTRSLSEPLSVLRNRRCLDWPRSDDAQVNDEAALLLADFEHLLKRADSLARECEQGMSTLANSSALEESRRSANLALAGKKLALVGTIFIPMSFVCSVWGTNFKEMGSGTQPIWMLFASAAPVLGATLILYHWDSITLKLSGLRAGGSRHSTKSDFPVP